MDNHEYWKEIESLAEGMVDDAMQYTDNDREEAEEYINDTLLHETIDGHRWVIYYSYNLDVIRHSNNDSYYADNFGGDALAESVKQGIENLHCHVAFWAMYADVQEYLEDAFDDYEEEEEEEEA